MNTNCLGFWKKSLKKSPVYHHLDFFAILWYTVDKLFGHTKAQPSVAGFVWDNLVVYNIGLPFEV